MRVSNTGVIDAHAGYGDVPLSIAEAFHSDWIGRHVEEDDEGPEDGYGAGDEVHVFPGGEGAGDVAETVVD